MSQDKRHPKTVYDGKYPFVRIEITESGHEIHYDDTPKKERIRESHKSGTYREISKDGKQVNMVVGNRVEYTKQGKTTTVDKNHDEKIGGSSRVSIHGGSHTEVKGNHSTAVDGDHKTMVGKDVVTAVKGDMVTGVKGKTKYRMGDGIEIKGDQKIDTKIDAAANLAFGDILTITAEKDIVIESKTQITLKVGGSHIILKDGVIHIKSGDVRIGGGSKVEVVSDLNLVTPPWTPGGQPPE